MGSLGTSLKLISCPANQQVFSMFGKVCALLCVVVLTTVQAQKAEHRSDDEESARILFSNYTSGLISLFPVNSTTYSTVSLIIAGTAVALVVAYLLSTSPASFQSQSQSQFRGFKGINGGMEFDLLGLVSTAMKVYSALNEEDDE